MKVSHVQRRAVLLVLLVVMVLGCWWYIRRPEVSAGQLSASEYSSLVAALKRRGGTTSTNIHEIELLGRQRVRVYTKAVSHPGGEILLYNKRFGWWRLEKEGRWLE